MALSTEEKSKTHPKDKPAKVETELADTLIYLTQVADKLDIDLLKVAKDNIDINKQRYAASQQAQYLGLNE